MSTRTIAITDLTDDRAELRRLLAESARPGEVFQVAYGHHYDYAVHDRAGWTVAECAGEHWVRLIAAAVNALPGLLDALEKAEAHRDSLAATLIEVQHRVADAWDEGFTAGVNADMGDYEHPDDGSWSTNPYRLEGGES